MPSDYEKMSNEQLRELRLAHAAAVSQIENENSHDPAMNQALVRMLPAEDALEALDAEVARDPNIAERLVRHAVRFLGHHRILFRVHKDTQRRAAPNN